MSQCVPDPEVERGEGTYHPRVRAGAKAAEGSELKEIMMRAELSLDPSAPHIFL